MTRFFTIALIASLLSLPFAPSSRAEQKSVTVPAASIDPLIAAVNRLAAALETDQKGKNSNETLQKLNLAITYLSFRSRRIESLEREITAMKSSRSAVEETQRSYSERVSALVERQKETQGEEGKNLLRMIEDSKIQLASFKERLTRLESDIIQAENRIFELQRETNSIEGYIERHLELE